MIRANCSIDALLVRNHITQPLDSWRVEPVEQHGVEAARPHRSVSRDIMRGDAGIVIIRARFPGLSVKDTRILNAMRLLKELGFQIIATHGTQRYLAEHGVAVNSLWPRTTIATAAIEVHFPPEILKASRQPAIMADAAYAILNRDSRRHSGNFYIDEAVLREEGITEFAQYAVTPGARLHPDLFLD